MRDENKGTARYGTENSLVRGTSATIPNEPYQEFQGFPEKFLGEFVQRGLYNQSCQVPLPLSLLPPPRPRMRDRRCGMRFLTFVRSGGGKRRDGGAYSA